MLHLCIITLLRFCWGETLTDIKKIINKNMIVLEIGTTSPPPPPPSLPFLLLFIQKPRSKVKYHQLSNRH